MEEPPPTPCEAPLPDVFVGGGGGGEEGIIQGYLATREEMQGGGERQEEWEGRRKEKKWRIERKQRGVERSLGLEFILN